MSDIAKLKSFLVKLQKEKEADDASSKETSNNKETKDQKT